MVRYGRQLVVNGNSPLKQLNVEEKRQAKNATSKLYSAAEEGELEVLKDCIKDNANVNAHFDSVGALLPQGAKKVSWTANILYHPPPLLISYYHDTTFQRTCRVTQRSTQLRSTIVRNV